MKHHLLDRNHRWAKARITADPTYFQRLASEHKPSALFVGCADARTPLNLVTDTDLGELFIHRNIANQVHPTDASLSASLQYAVEVLGVRDVIVCGHTACGGVCAAVSTSPVVDHVEAWIAPLRMLARLHAEELDECPTEAARVDRLVELNVIEQVGVLSRHPTVRRAWRAGTDLTVHGWVFDLQHGVLEPVITVNRSELRVLDGKERLAAG